LVLRHPEVYQCRLSFKSDDCSKHKNINTSISNTRGMQLQQCVAIGYCRIDSIIPVSGDGTKENSFQMP
jgi:hypothetical protein